MKTYFLINSLTNGGAERVVLTLSEKFLSQGDEVTIISLNRNDRYPVPEGVKMVYLSGMNDEGSGIVRMLLIPYYAWKLRRYSRQHKIAVIQSHLARSNFVNVLSRLFAAPHQTQLVSHGIASEYRLQGMLGKVYLGLMRFFYARADLLISISHRMREDFRTLFSFTNRHIVLHNPYDIERIRQLAEEPVTPDEFVFEPHKRYLIGVGKLLSLKRYEDIIMVLARLPHNIELLLLGSDGGELNRLQNLSQELGLIQRVHFLGHTPNPFKFIRQSDLFILTSRTEGFPNVLIEALASQTAVVSTDCVSGPREILAPDTNIHTLLTDKIEAAQYGLLYPVGDQALLYEAVMHLLDNPLLREQYVQQGIKRAENFDIGKIADSYRDILQGV